MGENALNWRKVDIIAVDEKGNQYELKDCKVTTSLTGDFSQEQMMFQGTPVLDPNRTYSLSFDVEHVGGDFTSLMGWWVQKPKRFTKSDKLRCPRKTKKAIKKYLDYDICRSQGAFWWQREWDRTRRY